MHTTLESFKFLKRNYTITFVKPEKILTSSWGPSRPVPRAYENVMQQPFTTLQFRFRAFCFIKARSLTVARHRVGWCLRDVVHYQSIQEMITLSQKTRACMHSAFVKIESLCHYDIKVCSQRFSFYFCWKWEKGACGKWNLQPGKSRFS